MINYDSSLDTLLHINRVRHYLYILMYELITRSENHDRSKLEFPEKECFDIITPRLKNTTYGSDEYKSTMKEFKTELDHHQKNNSHHPEFYDNGIKGFDIVDLLEMVCDWKAASERHSDGDIMKSIEINKNRFNYSDDLVSILQNTVNRFFK